MCIVNLRGGAWSREVMLAAYHGAAGLPPSLAQLDEAFARRMPSGNIWVRFQGFDLARPDDETSVTGIYYRGNYAAFPRRVYVAAPSVTVNNGVAMVPPCTPPDRALMQQLGLRWQATFTRDDKGQLSFEIQELM